MELNEYISGVIAQWDDRKAYGFITTAENRRLFFHISNMAEHQHRPRQGDEVLFFVRQDAQKRFYADEVRYACDLSHSGPADYWMPLRWLAHCYPLGILSFFFFFHYLNYAIPAIAATILCNSLLTMLFYRADKGSANAGARRIPEKTLHIWEFSGGWPGALIAQYFFHHKSRKNSFIVRLYQMIVLNILLISAFFYLAWKISGKSVWETNCLSLLHHLELAFRF